ncbi:hypothetical protein [Actinoplanes sp. CA-252034]|uniref:hypothetical protein n=1 Tax=Actinoplanes sp. CA-252034 TaxID=3239906 RepID=UPI003D99940F
MSVFSVDPAAVQGMSAMVLSASSDVAHLWGMLDRGARQPESKDVSGSSEAAGDYREVLSSGVDTLKQLEAALEGLSQRLSAASRLYAETETANTVRQEP